MELRSKHAVGSSLMDAFEAIMKSVPEILVADLGHPLRRRWMENFIN